MTRRSDWGRRRRSESYSFRVGRSSEAETGLRKAADLKSEILRVLGLVLLAVAELFEPVLDHPDLRYWFSATLRGGNRDIRRIPLSLAGHADCKRNLITCLRLQRYPGVNLIQP